MGGTIFQQLQGRTHRYIKVIIFYCAHAVRRPIVDRLVAISKLIYLASSVESSDAHLKQANKIIFNFIWNGKRDRVKRDTVIASRHEGGLNMINFILQDQAMKLNMLKRILQPGNERWKIIPRHYLNFPGKHYFILHANQPSEERIIDCYY